MVWPAGLTPEFEQDSQPIPAKKYLQDWKYPLSVFATTSIGNFMFNIAVQVLFQFAVGLPDQTEALSIQSAFYDIISIGNSGRPERPVTASLQHRHGLQRVCEDLDVALYRPEPA